MPKWYHSVISPRWGIYQFARNSYLTLFKRDPKKIKRAVEANKAFLRLNLGCGYDEWPGWVNADFPNWDMLNENDWKQYLGNHKVDVIYTEHVLEHLDFRQVDKFISLCAKYLKPGGVVRSAVPDEYNPSNEYYHMFKPQPMASTYEKNTEHQTFWNHDSLGHLFKRYGFEVKPIEYFDADGNFHEGTIDPKYGPVKRTFRSDFRERHLRDVEREGDALEWIRLNKHTLKHDYIYSSLVIDAIKQ
jgi:predicted SAM-dependent methyltransferase